MAELFDYTYLPNMADQTLVVLHGTGGSKEDWLFLNDALDKQFNILSLSGNVEDMGKRRFFLRNQNGVFDIVKMREEMDKLVAFISSWKDDHKFDCASLLFLGYSNGASMLLGMLFEHPHLLQNAVLLHPILPFTPDSSSLNLQANQVFVSIGVNDQIISYEESQRVIEVLQNAKAHMLVREFSRGHEVHHEEVEVLREYLLQPQK